MHIQLGENTLEDRGKAPTLTEISRWMWQLAESLDEGGSGWLGRCLVVLLRDLSILGSHRLPSGDALRVGNASAAWSCSLLDTAAAGRSFGHGHLDV